MNEPQAFATRSVRSITDYLTLGHTGLRVSPICLGTATFGEDQGWGASPTVSAAILSRYLELGGNFVDCANVYTHGHAEQIVGDHFAAAGHRDRAVIASKFCGNLFPADPNGGGAGRKSLIAACEQSLRRLQTDYIDLYWMHMWDSHTPVEETLRALDDLVRAGKVRYIGFSNTPAWKTAQAHTLAQMRGWTPLAAIQIEYSLIERSVEAEQIAMARDLELGVTAWGPLKGGLLSGKYGRSASEEAQPDRGLLVTSNFNSRNFNIVDAVLTTATEAGIAPAGVALAWLLCRPGLTSILLGARTVEQFEANVRDASTALDLGAMDLLDRVSQPAPTATTQAALVGPSSMHGGLSVNGQLPPLFPLAPRSDTKIW